MSLNRALAVDPLSQAHAVADPAIKEIIDLDVGESIGAIEFIEKFSYPRLIDERGKILSRMQREEPRFCCSLCNVPVYIVSQAERRAFFFRHRSEDGSCPAETRSPLSYEEICARKYHGLRESEPHKRIKALLLRSLDADPEFRDIKHEKKWAGRFDPARYRRPDVQADHDDGKLAFEVQLSTTFLSVVVGRRDFYCAEGGLLVWVFGRFDPHDRRLCDDDIFFSNNSNIVVIDEETTIRSENSGRFHVRCHYRRPVRDGDRVINVWEDSLIPFTALTQDRDRQQTYLFDYASTEIALLGEIRSEAIAREAAHIVADQEVLFEFWKRHGHRFRHTPENRQEWAAIRDLFAGRDIELPLYPDSDPNIQAMLNCLYSAREGVPIGYKFSRIIQVAHQIAESYPSLLVAFGYGVRLGLCPQALEDQDSSGKWRTRLQGTDDVPGITVRMRRRNPELEPDRALLPLMSFLFPEVANRVRTYLVPRDVNA